MIWLQSFNREVVGWGDFQRIKYLVKPIFQAECFRVFVFKCDDRQYFSIGIPLNKNISHLPPDQLLIWNVPWNWGRIPGKHAPSPLACQETPRNISFTSWTTRNLSIRIQVIRQNYFSLMCLRIFSVFWKMNVSNLSPERLFCLFFTLIWYLERSQISYECVLK